MKSNYLIIKKKRIDITILTFHINIFLIKILNKKFYLFTRP